MNDITSQTPLGNLDWALWLASLGYAVFPLNPATRKPFSNKDVAAIIHVPEPPESGGGFKFATTDPASLRAWWSKWPGAMIGIRTGSVSGVYVLDIDRKNGKDGFATLNANGWTIPPTVSERSPSGGEHYYFLIPRDGTQHWNSDGSVSGVGIDRKGDGGFVVWYGANLSQPMAEPPAWMLADGGHPPGRQRPLGDPALKAPSFADAVTALNAHDPNDLGRDRWIAITCAFKQSVATLVPEPVARATWDIWCNRYEKNDVHENEKDWRSIRETAAGWSALRDGSPARGQLLLGNGQRRELQKQQDILIGEDRGNSAAPKIIRLDCAIADLVFVADGSAVINRHDKSVRKLTDARNEFSGSFHAINTGKLDKDGKPIIKQMPVIEAWLKSDQRKTVDVATWSPGEPDFCGPPEKTQAGDRAYNLWTHPRLLQAPPNWQEWVRPFVDHVAYLVPDEIERKRFTQWLAHILQRPQELPHTAYLMIATQTGIGRNTLASILTRALRGYVAANMDINALFGGFNGRISQKLLATVDEVREGNSAQRYEKQEAFKSKLTEETRALNPKYGLQSVEKNCCRWLMFSNHLDALPFDNSDRRVIVIRNPDQRLSADWFVYLRSLINDQNFIASVQQYLATLDLSDFSPFEIAPLNDAKRSALASMESAADTAARQFAATWPDDLATVAALREFIGDDAPANSRAMRHVIERAEMRTAHRQRVGARTETVIVVRGALTPADLASVSPAVIAHRVICRAIAI